MNTFEHNFNRIFNPPCRVTADEVLHDMAQKETSPEDDTQAKIARVLSAPNRKDIVIEALSECSILTDRVLGSMNIDPVGLLLIARAAASNDGKAVRQGLEGYYRAAGTSLDETLLSAVREFAASSWEQA